jgi:hypothetical protein
METLDAITALAVKETVEDREKVLELINLGQTLKQTLLRQLEVKELHGHPVYKRIEKLNFWPWSGMLENVVADVGRDFILKHWATCVASAQEDVRIVCDLMAERKKKDRSLEIEERRLNLLERATSAGKKAKKKIKGLLGAGRKGEKA